jgi:hypothetical protein
MILWNIFCKKECCVGTYIRTGPPAYVSRLRGGQISCFIIVLGREGISMTRTIYILICGALIFLAAVTPVVILIVDKARF